MDWNEFNRQTVHCFADMIVGGQQKFAVRINERGQR